MGSFAVSNGLAAGTDPSVYSCVQACAFLFGSAPSNLVYACSTDNTTVNHLAWGSGYGAAGNTSCTGGTPEADTYSLSSSGGGYAPAPSFSAYVDDK